MFDVTEAPEAAKALIEAKGYIEKYGWKQGSFGEYGGPRCMAGALMGVTARMDEWDVLQEVCDGAMIAFNDASGRTKEEVLAKMDEAIQLAFATANA